MDPDRVVIGVLGAVCRRMWGFTPRMIPALTDGAHPADESEARLAHLVRMIGTMNGIANAENVEPDEAHNPVNRDTALKARHAEMWATTT
jgi:hypothetical protein